MSKIPEGFRYTPENKLQLVVFIDGVETIFFYEEEIISLVKNAITAVQQLNITEYVNIVTVIRVPLELTVGSILLFRSCDRILIIEEHKVLF